MCSIVRLCYFFSSINIFSAIREWERELQKETQKKKRKELMKKESREGGAEDCKQIVRKVGGGAGDEEGTNISLDTS